MCLSIYCRKKKHSQTLKKYNELNSNSVEMVLLNAINDNQEAMTKIFTTRIATES